MSALPADPSSRALVEARLRGSAGSLALDLAFELHSAWTVLFGPSGAGKSTILRALCGLTGLREQQVLLNGLSLTNVPCHRRRIAMVSQNTALFPHMTALQNVLFALRSRDDLSRSEKLTEARSLLDRFHAAEDAGKYPRMLSGGEQQRVALARAIASSPRLLLLDEAFSGLQTHLRTELMDEVKQWQRDSGLPVISVTHDLAEALGSGDEVIRIADGRIIAQGSPEIVLADERAALLREVF